MLDINQKHTMKMTPKMIWLMLFGILFLNAGTFHSAIGIPDTYVIISMLLSMVCFLGFFREMKKAKAIASSTIPPPIPITPSKRKQKEKLILSIYILSGVSFPFIAPFTGSKAPLVLNIFASIVMLVIGVPIITLVLRKTRKDV
jgi:hypothetical protein